MKPFSKPLRPASLFIFLSLMTGILAGNCFSDNNYSLFLHFVLLFGLIGLIIHPNKKTVFIFILSGVFCFGYINIQSRLNPDLPSHHISNYLDLTKNIITARVVSFKKHYKRKTKIIVSCQTIKTENQGNQKVTGKINLSIYGFSKQTPMFGDIIAFESSVKSIRNFMNPGGFDYKRFLKLKGIYGSAWSDVKKIRILTSADQIGFFGQCIQKIEGIRTQFYHFIINQTQNSDSGKIMASLITGKKELISHDIRDLFSKAGISHLLAISGLHLSIVSLLFFYCFYRFLSFIPILLISGRSWKTAGILTILPLLCYAVFSGFSPSTRRALIMIVALIFSFVSEKEKDIISSLSIAGILILILDSTALFSISFQLSFTAVVFIIGGVALLKKYEFIFQKTFFSKTVLMIFVTFFAGIGVSPLTAHYFNIVSFVQVVSNCIAIPILGFIVLPAGLVVLLFFPCFPIISGFIVTVCSHLIFFITSFSKFLVSLPFSWLRTITLQWSEIILIYLFFVFIFLVFKGYRKSCALILVSIFLLGISIFSNQKFDQSEDSNLQITILDVGQGSSAFIQTSDNCRILVDGGGFSGSSSFDTGRYLVAPFLWQKRIRALDYVILTHPEGDHLNGLVFILENFKVHTLIKNRDAADSNHYIRLVKTFKKRNIKIVNPSNQYRRIDLGTNTGLIFYPPSFKESLSFDLNNNSLVFKLIYKDFSMLFPGDILKEREEKLSTDTRFDLHADILLSPHHGSFTSSSRLFLNRVQPKNAVISCGWKNRYGFPSIKVLKRYKNIGINIFRTDKHGAVFISSNGETFDITDCNNR